MPSGPQSIAPAQILRADGAALRAPDAPKISSSSKSHRLPDAPSPDGLASFASSENPGFQSIMQVRNVQSQGMEATQASLRAIYSKELPNNPSYPLQRLLKIASKIQIASAGHTSPEKLGEHFVQSDIRRQVFLLEGLLKLYAPRHPQLAKSLKRVKALEDMLGEVSYSRTLVKDAHALSAPKPVLKQLRKDARKSQKKLTQLIEKNCNPQIRVSLRHSNDVLKSGAPLILVVLRPIAKTLFWPSAIDWTNWSRRLLI
jgi:hypothetical protein